MLALLLAGCSGTTSALNGVDTAPEPALASADLNADLNTETTASIDPSVTDGQPSSAPPSEPTVLFAEDQSGADEESVPATAFVETQTDPRFVVTDTATSSKPRALEIPPEPDMGADRSTTVREIRAKSAATGKSRPSPFTSRAALAERVPKEELEQIRAELAAAAERNRAGISDAEAEAIEAKRKALRRQANRHYGDALNSIEN